MQLQENGRDMVSFRRNQYNTSRNILNTLVVSQLPRLTTMRDITRTRTGCFVCPCSKKATNASNAVDGNGLLWKGLVSLKGDNIYIYRLIHRHIDTKIHRKIDRYILSSHKSLSVLASDYAD